MPHLHLDWARPYGADCALRTAFAFGRPLIGVGLREWTGRTVAALCCAFGRRSWQGEPVVVNLRAGSVLFFDYRPAPPHIARTHAPTLPLPPPSIRGSSLGRRRQPDPESGVACTACVGDIARCTAHTASELDREAVLCARASA